MFSWLCACGCGEQILSEGEEWECFKCETDFPGKETAVLVTPEGHDDLVETDYEGYGVFGGIDAYSWLARMNGCSDIPIESEDDSDRGIGIDLFFDNRNGMKYPLKIVHERCLESYEYLNSSPDDPNQGWQTGKHEEGSIHLCDECKCW
jgi:hypothetical protein